MILCTILFNKMNSNLGIMVSGKYFNKGVKSLDSPHVGHVVRETSDKIVVFGEGDDRYDIPKDKIRFAAANVLIDLPFHEIVKNYKVSREDRKSTRLNSSHANISYAVFCLKKKKY